MSEQADESASTDGEPVRSPLSITLQPVRLSIGPANARMNWRLTLTNEGTAHIVAMRVWSDCITCRTAAPDRDDLAGPGAMQARLRQHAMLAPEESVTLAGEWQIQREAFVPFLGFATKILPLARIRVIGAAMAPTKAAFLIGREPAQDDTAPEALAADGALQVHSSLVARPVKARSRAAAVASDGGTA